jgi:NADH oxidase (H2O2-forming)
MTEQSHLKGEVMNDKKKLVIIGGGVAGFRIAALANEKIPELQIVIITNKPHGVCSTCGIPFGIENRFKLEKLILATPEYYVEKGIDVRFETEVQKIDLSKNQIHLMKSDQSDPELLTYDYLVITTGRVPFIPPIPGTDLEGVFTLSNYENAQALKGYLETQQIQKALVIGAGPIGMETAWALKQLGIETKVVELLPSIFPQSLDPDMAKLVQNHFENNGIEIYTSTSVNGMFSENSKVGIVTIGSKNEKIPVDLVVIATGIRPNVELAQKAGLEVGSIGGLVTDDWLRVKNSGNGEVVPNVYACGDCIQVINGITNQPSLSALASTVVPEARVIIEHIKKAGTDTNFKFESCLSPNITVVGALEVGSVGLTTHAAIKAGFNDLIVAQSSGFTRSGYFPGVKKVDIKLIFHQDRIIGAQVVGGEGVKGRIDTLTTAIKTKLNVDDMLLLERSFTPPLALLVDPITSALEIVKENIERIR